MIAAPSTTEATPREEPWSAEQTAEDLLGQANDLIDEGVERVQVKALQHGRRFSGGRAKMAGGERGGHGKPPLELETCRMPNPNLEIHQPCTCRP